VRAILSALSKVNLDSSYSFQLVSRDFFQDAHWHKDTTLVIFPGGRDTPYQEALQGFPNQTIVEFVHSGGQFLGICAGGYYGSQRIIFEKGGALEILAERDLAFFPGIAEGPIYGLGQFCYESQKGSRIAKIYVSDLSLYMDAQYNGGCAFIDAKTKIGVEVLAHYSDLPGELAAVVKCRVGKGVAVLSGIHPEYPMSDCRLFPYLLEQLGLFFPSKKAACHCYYNT
jgi:biotin--protein ligase